MGLILNDAVWPQTMVVLAKCITLEIHELEGDYYV